MKTIILCADDYGLAPGVSGAIRELLAANRLSATSCMTVSQHWHNEGRLLDEQFRGADIGLHFTLTDQSPLGSMPKLAPADRFPTFFDLLKRAYFKHLDRVEIRDEFMRQLDAFREVTGKEPDFIDGHHHIHQLPIIRDVVIETLQILPTTRHCYLRSTSERLRTILRRGTAIAKSLAIGTSGLPLRNSATKVGIPMNDGFSGLYDFSSRHHYGDLFARFLVGARNKMLVMCHPGFIDRALERVDTVTSQREVEFKFLASNELSDLLNKAEICLGRYVK